MITHISVSLKLLFTLKTIAIANASHLSVRCVTKFPRTAKNCLQAQQQWAYEVDAVLLASGANNPKVGSGGSGIYQGKSGARVFDIIEEGGSKAFMVALPKHFSATVDHDDNPGNIDKAAKKMDGFYLKKDNLTPYTTSLITPKQSQVNEILCSGDMNDEKLCCHFDVALKWNDKVLETAKNHYQYRMVAFSGIRSFSGVYNGGVEICGIVACVDETVNSCANRFDNYDEISWPVTFKTVSITANFTIDEKRIQHPNSLLSSIRPLPADAVQWNYENFVDDGVAQRTYSLEKPQNRLMTFAIYGRDFNRDSVPLLDEGQNSDSETNFLMYL